MNRKALYALLVAGLVGVFGLVACSDKGDGDAETGTGPDATLPTTTAEAVTAIPRYDYLEAEVAKDVTIQKADYDGITLTIDSSYRIEDEDVKDYIESIRFQYRTAENGTTQITDKSIKVGDDAYIYYKGFMDGKEFEGGSNWDSTTPYKLGIGTGSFIDGFEEALVGVVSADTSKDKPFSIQVTFPEDYHQKDYAGKAATFQVAVMYIIQYKLPEVNREFVLEDLEYETQKEFYASDKALLTEFESFVMDQMVANNQTEINNAKTEALWEHLTSTIVCTNLPQMELDYYKNAYIQELDYYYELYCTNSGEEFKEMYPTKEDFAPDFFFIDEGADWQTEVNKMAEKMVKKDMILHAIGELEGMETVTDEEYQAQIDFWVQNYYGSMTESEIEKSMGEVFLRESAFSDKMSKWLMEQVKFTYEDGTPIQEPPAES